MHLIAQLPGSVPGLSIEEDSVLHLFACRWFDVCDNLNQDQGHSATVIVPQAELGDAITPYPWPSDLAGTLAKPDALEFLLPAMHPGQVPMRMRCVIGEVHITGFKKMDDGVTDEWLPFLFDPDTFFDIPESQFGDAWYNSRFHTKFGGAPLWCGDGPNPRVIKHDMSQELQISCYCYLDEEVPRDLVLFDRFGMKGDSRAPDASSLSIGERSGPPYVTIEASPYEGGMCHLMKSPDGSFTFVESR